MFKLILILTIISISLFSKTKVIESNSDYIIFSYSTNFKGFSEIKTSDGFLTYLPKIDKAYQKDGIAGQPIVLQHTELIAIPNENTFTVELISSPEYDQVNALMTPYVNVLSEDNLNKDYRINSKYFDESDISFMDYHYAGISGNTKFIRVIINAAYYDTKLASIVIPKEVLVKVKYNHKSKTAVNSKRKIDSNKLNVLNSNIASDWIEQSNNKNANQLLEDEKNYSDGDWFKFKISKNGVYKITAAQLSANGINIPKDKINTIKIIGNGGKPLSEIQSVGKENKLNEHSIIVNKDNAGNLSEIIFFASGTKGFEYKNGNFERYLNWYSNDNYYLFTWGGDEGLRAVEEEINGEVVNKPTTYTHRMFFEEDLYNPYPSGGGRQFLGKTFNNLTLTNVLNNLDRNGQVNYKIALAHTSSESAYVKVSENKNAFKQRIYLSPVGGYTVASNEWGAYTIDAAQISNDNRSKIDLEYQGNNISNAFLDYYEIHYPRSFVAINNELEFWSNPTNEGITEYNVNGFSSSAKYAYDISDLTNPKLLKNFASDMDKIIIRPNLTANSPSRFYMTCELSNAPTLEKIDFVNLRKTKANNDIILITDNELLPSAQEYKKYREANSDYSVGIFTTNSIYNEFGSGVSDIVAIRDFISNAFFNWDKQPKYVILWGDGHTDHRKIAHKVKNYVPPFLSIDTLNFDETKSTSFDDFYVRLNGDDTAIDISIGRITINSNEEGLNVINKIDHYENNSSIDDWRKRVTLVADDSYTSNDTESLDHVAASEKLANLSAMSNFTTNKIYLPEYQTVFTANGRTKPQANKAIINSLREDGSVVINWTGHGNPTVWSHEGVFTQSGSVRELNNLDKLSFFCAATCEYGRFDQITGITTAEELLLSPKGGAIAVFAATRLVYASSNSALNELFFDILLNKNPQTNQYRTLGDVLYALKQERTASNDEKYILIGDPTLKLLIPENNIEFHQINNIKLSDNNDMIDLEGLTEITINGSITDVNKNKLTSFNGNVLFSIFDGDEDINITDGVKKFNYTKYGGILNKSSYVVENGEFEATIILPKDISYSARNGRMFAYAVNTENTETAKGNFDRFFVSGVGEGAENDMQGPEISIFVDSRSFENGDIVSNDPLLIVDLEDVYGINSTGNGIGHKIEAWLNDDPKSMDLSRNYTTSIGNSRLGTSQIQLEKVKPGLNKVTVRAWDIFNNFSIKNAYFYIKGDESDLWLGGIKNYPNPFESETFISFRHNLEIPFDADINIYDINGNLINSISETKYNKYIDEVRWDGRNSEGVPINSGSYYIQVNLTDSNNKKVTKSGILSLKVK